MEFKEIQWEYKKILMLFFTSNYTFKVYSLTIEEGQNFLIEVVVKIDDEELSYEIFDYILKTISINMKSQILQKKKIRIKT